MSQSLKCPSCNAPLEIENEYAAIIECDFCGVSSRMNAFAAESGIQMNFGGAGLLEQARKLKEIKQLALAGNAIYAIKLYRETFGVGLAEAKDAVDNIIAGKPVVFTNVQNFPAQNAFGGIGDSVNQALKIAQIQGELQRGNKINAIKIYRETFGGSLAEAKDAVEAMERGGNFSLPSQAQVKSTYGVYTNNAGQRKPKSGGSFIGALLITIVLIAVVSLVAFWFISGAVTKTTKSFTDNFPGGSKQTETSQFAREILRFGGEGVGAGMFTDNRNVAVDGEGKIYSVDYIGGRMQIFDANGKFLTQWFIDKEFGVFGLGVSRDGIVYVIQSGELSTYEAMTGNRLTQTKHSSFRDLAVGLDDSVTAINSTGTIYRYDKDFKATAIFKDAAKTAGISGGFDYVAVNGLNEIFVMNRNGKDVCKFSADGKFVDRFKTKANSVNDLAVDPKGRVFVSDTNQIYVYTAEGEFINQFETRQSFGMTFNDQGEIFVASRPFVVKYQLQN